MSTDGMRRHRRRMGVWQEGVVVSILHMRQHPMGREEEAILIPIPIRTHTTAIIERIGNATLTDGDMMAGGDLTTAVVEGAMMRAGAVVAMAPAVVGVDRVAVWTGGAMMMEGRMRIRVDMKIHDGIRIGAGTTTPARCIPEMVGVREDVLDR